MTDQTILCGNASDNLYLTFKGGCRKELTYQECYRCTGCGGRFHKDCILEHFKLEAKHDWGRQAERQRILDSLPEEKIQTVEIDGDFEDGERYCSTCGQYQFDSPFECDCTKFNATIAAVRSIIAGEGK